MNDKSTINQLSNISKSSSQKEFSLKLVIDDNKKISFKEFSKMLNQHVSSCKWFYINDKAKRWNEEDVQMFSNPVKLEHKIDYNNPFDTKMDQIYKSRYMNEYNSKLAKDEYLRTSEIEAATKRWNKFYPEIEQLKKSKSKEKQAFIDLAVEITYVILLERLIYVHRGGAWRKKMCEMLCYALTDLIKVGEISEFIYLFVLAGLGTNVISMEEQNILYDGLINSSLRF